MRLVTGGRLDIIAENGEFTGHFGCSIKSGTAGDSERRVELDWASRVRAMTSLASWTRVLPQAIDILQSSAIGVPNALVRVGSRSPVSKTSRAAR